MLYIQGAFSGIESNGILDRSDPALRRLFSTNPVALEIADRKLSSDSWLRKGGRDLFGAE